MKFELARLIKKLQHRPVILHRVDRPQFNRMAFKLDRDAHFAAGIRSGDAPGRGEQEEKNEGEEGSHVWRSEVEADHTTAQRRRSSYLALKRAPNTTLHFRLSLVFAL